MRRKKIFIAIVILLVLGLGLYAEYQRRTGDVEFEIPSLMSPRACMSPSWDSSIAVSNEWVVCEDFELGLTAFHIQDKARIKVTDLVFDTTVAMDEPWIVWADSNGVSACDLRDSRQYSLSQERLLSDAPAIDGPLAVWVELERDLVGYNLETKSRFSIVTGRKVTKGEEKDGTPFEMWSSANRRNPAICGDFVVWLEDGYDSPFKIWGYILRTKEKWIIRESDSELLRPRISGNYVVWKEEKPSDPNETLFNLMVYNLRDRSCANICEGMDWFSDIDISGDIVVWDHYSDRSGSDIFGHNLSIGKTFCISSEGSPYAPKISGHTVVWCDGRPQGWLDKLLRKEPCQIRGKIFRHWPGEEK